MLIEINFLLNRYEKTSNIRLILLPINIIFAELIFFL